MIKVAFDERYVHPLPENHRFPMEKYDLLPKQLLLEGIISNSDFFAPGFADREVLRTIHQEEYIHRYTQLQLSAREQRITGFVHSASLVERELAIVEGTRACAEFAFRNKTVALNIAGGTHHAFSDRGEGFCMLNDNAVAAQWLIDNGMCSHILIIDLDVHQGNGTAEIFRNNPSVYTFSMHGEHNYPLQKEQSDLDVGLKDGIRDREYLYLLEKNLNYILSVFTPDFIFYQCGVDILETDKLGRLGVSIQGCLERDTIVFKTARMLGVPIVCSMGGGYSPEIRHIVNAHANTFRAASHYFG